jgi:hypothetical protein
MHLTNLKTYESCNLASSRGLSGWQKLFTIAIHKFAAEILSEKCFVSQTFVLQMVSIDCSSWVILYDLQVDKLAARVT